MTAVIGMDEPSQSYRYRVHAGSYKAISYSLVPLSPTNHCSLFLNNTLNVVSEP